MTMKNKLFEQFPTSKFVDSSASVIYMADFSKRTNSVRAVEICENSAPLTPDGSKDMDCLSIMNHNGCLLTFNIFDDNQFTDDLGNTLKHPEACLFIQDNLNWICFIEIKDCKPKNVTTYNSEIKEKMKVCKQCLLDVNILQTSHKVYALASYPRKKTSFDDSIFNDTFEVKRLYDETGIIFIASNSISVTEKTIERIQ